MSIERARSDLAAARLLFGAGFFDRAVSGAYYATFRAATTALLALDERRKPHHGLIAAFGQKVVLEGGLDPSHGRAINILLELRTTADYAEDEASREIAERAMNDAEQFRDAVESWLRERHPEPRAILRLDTAEKARYRWQSQAQTA
ncbi:MAG: HEPN domain-containing protein [Actinobacteria bacterium]|nr:HEPN domain-containing protein [Actinomycetota bacterium]